MRGQHSGSKRGVSAGPPASPATLIRRRMARAETREGYVALLLRVLACVAVAWLLLTQVFMVAQQSGSEMNPAVVDGDILLAYRLDRDFAKGDVILYRSAGETRVGRVAAKGGDVVDIDDDGTLRVNGTVQDDVVYPTYAPEGGALTYPYAVPEGTVFVLGDHRTEAYDSRAMGPVVLSNVDAKVFTLIRRRGL